MKLFISHAQLSVFVAGLDSPFNDWTDDHVSQGFSWRDGSVSFSTLIDSGQIDLSIENATDYTLSKEVQRCIEVPFKVPDSGEIEIATIAESKIISVKPGDYRLIFEQFLKNDEFFGKLYFVWVTELMPAKIHKADSLLHPGGSLIMKAVSA